MSKIINFFKKLFKKKDKEEDFEKQTTFNEIDVDDVVEGGDVDV